MKTIVFYLVMRYLWCCTEYEGYNSNTE